MPISFKGGGLYGLIKFTTSQSHWAGFVKGSMSENNWTNQNKWAIIQEYVQVVEKVECAIFFFCRMPFYLYFYSTFSLPRKQSDLQNTREITGLRYLGLSSAFPVEREWNMSPLLWLKRPMWVKIKTNQHRNTN